MVLFSILRYLAGQGLAIRGYTNENSNYYKLLELRSNKYLKDVLSSEKGKNDLAMTYKLKYYDVLPMCFCARWLKLFVLTDTLLQ